MSPRYLTEQETKQANTYCVIVTDESFQTTNHGRRDASLNVKLVIYAGEGHRFRKLSNLEDLRTRVVDWFGLYLREKQS